MLRSDEEFLSQLPRSETLDGDDLTVADVLPGGNVVITDGARAAIYGPHEAEALTGPDIRIVPDYVEAGWFTEAIVIHLTDGTRDAMYTPRETLKPAPRPGHPEDHVTRTIAGQPILWTDPSGVTHLCERAIVHDDVPPLTWTLCGRDVAAKDVHSSAGEPPTCLACLRAARPSRMPGIDCIRSTFDDFSCCIDDALAGPEPTVAEAWHAELQQIEDFLAEATIAPGLTLKMVDLAPDDAAEERSAVRLELHSTYLPDVVLHLSTERAGAMPSATWWTRMRRGVGLLERDWDEMGSAEAVAVFIDRHNQRAGVDHGEGT